MITKNTYSVLLALLLAACSRTPDELRGKIEQQQAQIAGLEREAADLRQALQKLESKPAPPPDPAIAGLENNLAQLTESNYRLESRMTTLESRSAELGKAKAVPTEAEPAAPPLGKLLPSKTPAVSIYSAPDDHTADFIATPSAENTDRFPLRISGVSGRKTIVGTHKTTRIIDSAETYKDAFGRKLPVRKEVQEDINEYAHEVVFSVQNLTRTEKTLSYTAGGLTRSLTVQPGETVNDVVVRSSIGADLHIEVGGQLRNFPVTYD